MKKESSGNILLWAGVAFAVLIAMWTGLIIFTSRHPIAEVPLATGPAKH